MKKMMLSLATVLLFTVAGFAQADTTDPNAGTQGTQSSSPSMQQGTQSGSSGQMGEMNGTKGSEKTLRGCVAQQNGQYVLETKHGKTVALTGEDVSAHVGHTVAVHGMWASANAGTQSSATAAGTSGPTFDVTKVKMISSSCSTKGNMSTGSSDATPQQ
jgi:Protein of unknown function (DUF5818)